MVQRIISRFAQVLIVKRRLQRLSALISARRTAAVRIIAALAILVGADSHRPAVADIAIVDNPITPISSGGNPTTFDIASFTVSPAANVLIVEVGTRGVNGSADTITYGGQTLTLATQFPSVNTVFRDSAIYYLYNPTPGTATLTGTFSPTGISDYVLSAFTLGGVNTAIAPITAGADGQTSATTTATLTAAQAANVVAGFFRRHGADPQQRHDAIHLFGNSDGHRQWDRRSIVDRHFGRQYSRGGRRCREPSRWH